VSAFLRPQTDSKRKRHCSIYAGSATPVPLVHSIGDEINCNSFADPIKSRQTTSKSGDDEDDEWAESGRGEHGVLAGLRLKSRDILPALSAVGNPTSSSSSSSSSTAAD